MCAVKWNEVSVDGLRSPNGGGRGRLRPFVNVAIWQALCWPRIAEIPLQGLKSAEVLVFCTRAGISELLAYDEWGVCFSFRKSILYVQRTGRNGHSRNSRGTALRNTNACRLWGNGRPRLWAHTSLGRTRKGG